MSDILADDTPGIFDSPSPRQGDPGNRDHQQAAAEEEEEEEEEEEKKKKKDVVERYFKALPPDS